MRKKKRTTERKQNIFLFLFCKHNIRGLILFVFKQNAVRTYYFEVLYYEVILYDNIII